LFRSASVFHGRPVPVQRQDLPFGPVPRGPARLQLVQLQRRRFVPLGDPVQVDGRTGRQAGVQVGDRRLQIVSLGQEEDPPIAPFLGGRRRLADDRQFFFQADPVGHCPMMIVGRPPGLYRQRFVLRGQVVDLPCQLGRRDLKDL